MISEMEGSTLSEANWRRMELGDIDSVVEVAVSAFPDHPEARECFEERLALFSQGCFVLQSSSRVSGYLIIYPWALGEIPPLNSLLGALPETRETYYLHDLALAPEIRGRGYTRLIVEQVTAELAKLGGRKVALVSVNQSLNFWTQMGFTQILASEAVNKKLASYGDGAAYMVRDI